MPVQPLQGVEEEIQLRDDLLDAVDQAVIATGCDGRILYWNLAAERLYGWSKSETLGRAVDELHPLELPQCSEAIASRVRAGEAWTGEVSIRRRDGSACPALVAERPIRGPHDGVIGILSTATDLSSIARAQHEQRASEMLLSEVQRIARLGSWEWDIASGRVTWTDELYRICGVPRDTELTYERFLEVVHPDDREMVQREIDTALATKSGFDYDFRIVWPDGTVRIEHDRGRVVLDDAGRPVRMLGTGQDVTETRLAEMALRESEERYRGLVELAPDGIIVRSGRVVVFANNAAARQLGAPHPDALVGMGVLDLIHPDSRALGAEQLDQERPPGSKSPLQSYKLLRLDGTSFHAEVTSIALTYRGQPAVQTVVRDVTARLEAAAEMRRQALVFETIGDAVLVMDPTGVIIDWNPAAERTFGYTKAEMLGRRPMELHHPAMGDQLHYVIRDALAAHGRWAGEIRFVRKDGSEAYADVVVVVQYDATGRAIAQIGVHRDITERKRAEERLQLSDRLEAVGQLAGGVAHDFNNLLTAITGYTQFLLDAMGVEDKRRSDLLEIKKAADRAASLTRQLLAFSRKQVLQPRVLDVNQIVSELEKMLRRLIGEHIALTTGCTHGVARVMADPGQLEQVIVNLAVNARDAMPDGGTLTIRTALVTLGEDGTRAQSERELPPGAYVMLSISDTGIGMDKATQGRVFEPFFTTKAFGKGTGLGLATVYGIVKQSGGYIWLDSEPGQGTTFTIYLRAVDQPLDMVIAASADPSRDVGHVGTILLVEDEDAVRVLARRVLEQAGYTVLEARDGVEGVRLVERHEGTIELVLTDVVMPHLSGRALAERLRETRPDVPVLFISGYTDGEIEQRTLVGPDAAYLQKPFTPQTLRDRVRQLLESTRGGSPGRRSAARRPARRPL